MIGQDLPAGAGQRATVFLTTKGLLYAFIVGTHRLTFGEVKKILARMNLRPELFLPPRADANYFRDIGARKFREVFPGREVVSDDDLTFYKTLAPYNPALVQIAEIKDGVIRQYDTDAVGNWRPGVKFQYRRIRAS
jgi:hypothetical protein